MAKWALMVDGRIHEVFDYDPRGRFHPSLRFEQVPDDAKPEPAQAVHAPPWTPSGEMRRVIREIVEEVLRERSASTPSGSH